MSGECHAWPCFHGLTLPKEVSSTGLIYIAVSILDIMSVNLFEQNFSGRRW